MADITKLSRLLGGVQRQVDLSTNTLVVGDIKVGGTGGTTLTQTILNRLINLQNGTDVDATYHTHDGRYYTETELGSSTSSSGSDLIGDDNTYSNFTPAAATVKGALSGIDAALATGSGRVKVTSNDTTSDYLSPSLTVDVGSNSSAALEKSVQNPGGDETLRIRLDTSKIDHGTLTGLGDDDHTIYTKADGTRAFTGDQSMGSNKLTNLAYGTVASDAVRRDQIVGRDDGTSDFSASSKKITNVADPASAQDAATKNYVDTQDALKVSKSGDSMTGNLAMGGNLVTGLGSPVAGTDAANKNYVDAAIGGLSWKTRVRAASTANLTLSGTQTVDGVALIAGDRILVKDQSTGSANGIYVVAAGAWSRATDADSAAELDAAAVFVTEGTANADTAWVQTADSITLGTTSLVFTQFAGNGTIQAGVGLSYSGNTLNVNLGAGIQQLPTDEVGVDLYSAGGLELVDPGTGLPSSATDAQIAAKIADNSLLRNSSGLSVKRDSAGAVGLTASGVKVNVDATTIEIAANALQVKSTIAGDGLSMTSGVINVNTDGVTIETSGDAIQVKDSGISTAKIANAAVDETKLAASVAGNGLSGGAGSALSVNVDGSTIEINSDTLRVKDLGITTAKLADDAVTTQKILNANVTLAKLASDSVDENKIVSTAHDATMTGGSGSKLSVASSPRGLKSMVAGESMAANTSFLVRFAVSGETAGRVYKADQDATSTDKFYAIGIALKTTSVAAGDSVDVTFEGTHILGSSDAAFSAGDIGKPVYLTASGAFSTTAPSTTNYAVYRIGVVEATDRIWVGGIQINGVN